MNTRVSLNTSEFYINSAANRACENTSLAIFALVVFHSDSFAVINERTAHSYTRRFFRIICSFPLICKWCCATGSLGHPGTSSSPGTLSQASSCWLGPRLGSSESPPSSALFPSCLFFYFSCNKVYPTPCSHFLTASLQGSEGLGWSLEEVVVLLHFLNEEDRRQTG